MDLMSRGISFVSSEKVPDALAATTLIYKPGVTMHAVGMDQTIGRITGTARPDLQRRLYASKNVITNYKNYNKNQKQYMEVIKLNIGKATTDIIMEGIELNYKLTRALDRPKLKLKPKYKKNYVEELEVSNELTNESTNESINIISNESINTKIDGVKISNLHKWFSDDENTIHGKMIRYLYNINTKVSFEKFKNDINYTGTDDGFNSAIKHGRGIKCTYGKLWFVRNKNTEIYINENIKKYIYESLIVHNN